MLKTSKRFIQHRKISIHSEDKTVFPSDSLPRVGLRRLPVVRELLPPLLGLLRASLRSAAALAPAVGVRGGAPGGVSTGGHLAVVAHVAAVRSSSWASLECAAAGGQAAKSVRDTSVSSLSHGALSGTVQGWH